MKTTVVVSDIYHVLTHRDSKLLLIDVDIFESRLYQHRTQDSCREVLNRQHTMRDKEESQTQWRRTTRNSSEPLMKNIDPLTQIVNETRVGPEFVEGGEGIRTAGSLPSNATLLALLRLSLITRTSSLRAFRRFDSLISKSTSAITIHVFSYKEARPGAVRRVR